MLQLYALFVFLFCIVNRHKQKIICVKKRQNRPDTRKPFPVFDTEYHEKQRGCRNDERRPPTVKGMQETHHRCLAFRRTAFHDRTDQHFVQSSADGAERYANEQSYVRIGKKIGQKGKGRQPYARKNMRRNNCCAVSYFIDKFRRRKIDKKLQHEIDGYKKRYLFQRNSVSRLKSQK